MQSPRQDNAAHSAGGMNCNRSITVMPTLFHPRMVFLPLTHAHPRDMHEQVLMTFVYNLSCARTDIHSQFVFYGANYRVCTVYIMYAFYRGLYEWLINFAHTICFWFIIISFLDGVIHHVNGKKKTEKTDERLTKNIRS